MHAGYNRRLSQIFNWTASEQAPGIRIHEEMAVREACNLANNRRTELFPRNYEWTFRSSV